MFGISLLASSSYKASTIDIFETSAGRIVYLNSAKSPIQLSKNCGHDRLFPCSDFEEPLTLSCLGFCGEFALLKLCLLLDIAFSTKSPLTTNSLPSIISTVSSVQFIPPGFSTVYFAIVNRLS